MTHRCELCRGTGLLKTVKILGGERPEPTFEVGDGAFICPKCDGTGNPEPRDFDEKSINIAVIEEESHDAVDFYLQRCFPLGHEKSGMAELTIVESGISIGVQHFNAKTLRELAGFLVDYADRLETYR